MKFETKHKLSKAHYTFATLLPILLVGIITFSIATNYQNEINFNKKEIIGTYQLNKLFKLEGFVQKTRGVKHISLRNDDAISFIELIKKNRANVELIINEIISDKDNPLDVEQYHSLLKIKDKFTKVVESTGVKKSHQHYFNEYSSIIDKILILMRNVTIHSNLILDDQLENHHSVINMMEGLPKFTEEIGRARGLVSAIPMKSILSDIDNERINNRSDAILTAVNRLEDIQGAILKNSSPLYQQISYRITALKNNATSYSKIILLRKQNNFTIATREIIFDSGTEIINSAEALYSTISSNLRNKLYDRITKNHQYFVFSISTGVFISLAILFFAVYIYRLNSSNLSIIIKSRTMLETILNTIPVGVYWKDLNGKYLGANKVYLQNIGDEKLECLIGESDDGLNYTQGKIPSSMYDDDVIEGNKPRLHNKVVMAWENGPELIDISRVPLLNQDGSVFGLLGVYQDITESQHQHELLVKSESHYRHLIESSSAIPWEFDINRLQFTYVGPQAENIFGYPAEEWYQENFWYSHMHPDDNRELTINYCMNQIEKKCDHEIEYRMRTKEGQYIWVKDYIKVPLASENKNILRGFMFDISNEITSETSLRLLATAFESQQPIVITDKDATILRVNKAFTKTTGFEEHEIIGKTPKFLSSGYHDNNFYDEMWSILKTTGHWEGEIWNKRKNGDIHPLWEGITAVTDEKGELTHYIASFFDLSDRYETLAREKLILESTNEAIYGVDNEGVCTFVNPSCLNVLGYVNEAELIGKNIHELIRFPHAKNTFCPINNTSDQSIESFNYYNEMFWRKDGSSFPVECWSQPIKRANKVLGSVVSFIDITERKLQEQQLILSKNESDKANLAKSEFLARMSHELRTPLNAILGFTQLLHLDKSLSKSSKEFGKEIHNAGHHLLSLINDVLDLAKIEAGRINVEMKNIKLEDIINECAGLIIPLAQQSKIDFLYDAEAVKDISIKADSTRLIEVLLNLLSNAVKYNSYEGTIRLETELKDDSRLRLSVVDSGEGLSKNQLQMLFKPFERLGAEKTQIEGTGIGLVISKHIIEMMNGNIGVDSITGQGSTFWIELDYTNTISKAEKSSVVNTSDNIIDFSSIKNKIYEVLYVEDNPSNIRLLEYVLKEFPFIKLKIALSAESALDILEKNVPDLMIFDINLPGMNGYELLEKIKSIEKYRGIPVFAMSANAMTKDIESALMVGFSQYMTKPIDVPFFLQNLFNSLHISKESQNL